MMLSLTILLCCLTQAIVIANRCHCLNEGVCKLDFTCSCPRGFYGPICNQYAESYTIVFKSTPSGIRTIDIITGLKTDLKNLNIQDVVATGLGNLYTVTFHKALTEVDKDKLKAVAVSVSNMEPVHNLIDYNECIDGHQPCFGGVKCVNTPFSFQCGCPDAFEVKDSRCVQETTSPTKSSKTETARATTSPTRSTATARFETVGVTLGVLIPLVIILIVAIIVCMRRKRGLKQEEKA